MINPRRYLLPLLICSATAFFSAVTYAHENNNTPQYGNPWTIDPASIPATASGKLPQQPDQLPRWSSECPAPQTGGYPPASPGYPATSGYPPASPGYPATSGYPPASSSYPATSGYPPAGYGSGASPGASAPYAPNASYAYPYQGGWQQQQGYGYYSPYNRGGYGYGSGYPAAGYPGTGAPGGWATPYGLGGIPGVGSGMLPGAGNLFGFPSFW